VLLYRRRRAGAYDGGIRIEDTVVVREARCDILTPTSKELRGM
jgi:Xaa-Pro aminopeptidase